MGVQASSLVKPKLSTVWLLQSIQTRKRKDRQNNDKNTIVAQTIPPRRFNESPASPSIASSSTRCRARVRRSRSPRHKRPRPRFGYHISHLDEFLSNASLDCPGNIPMVLSRGCMLYQTQNGGQDEVPLPLGMVVNGVFLNRQWIYVQTPHGQEGYVTYSAVIPLGILPPNPCRPPAGVWESATDIFPKPHGGCSTSSRCTDEIGSRSECGSCFGGPTGTECGEESVDSLYLAATNKKKFTQSQVTASLFLVVLLVITEDFRGSGRRGELAVAKGDVVSLVGRHGPIEQLSVTKEDLSRSRHWFVVKDRRGRIGAIPAHVAGHGFL